MTEEEEVEEGEVLTWEEIEKWAKKSSQSLKYLTELTLPRLTKEEEVMAPSPPKRRLRCASLGVDLPLGSLFYPCCGADIEDAVKFFGSCVTECRFADPYCPPGGQPSERGSWRQLLIPHIKTVVAGPHEHWLIGHAGCPVHSYRKDGLHTLIEDVPDLSVFYYRGDSEGEGGSNQLWLSPVLFHTVLARLLDGGIIVTDGANCGPYRQDRGVPWSSLCSGAATGAEFMYAKRTFSCVGELESWMGKTVRVWQVTAST
jgi:hypothetical protein